MRMAWRAGGFRKSRIAQLEARVLPGMEGDSVRAAVNGVSPP
jgi:hypothetical protein